MRIHSSLHYTTLHYNALHCAALHYTTPHYTTLHYTNLSYTKQTTLHHTTLHYTLYNATLYYLFSNVLVNTDKKYLRDRSNETIVRVATLSKSLQNKVVILPNHSMLTADQPVFALPI